MANDISVYYYIKRLKYLTKEASRTHCTDGVEVIRNSNRMVDS